ncbi:hypothetical protein ANN_19386 [Periplaneta americana]|uniref:Glucose-methanol-choline oxidoreductase C-terminal domain-containing protein n=1 Tax=Periplaneta americana TaxID=6978 RepID=A0ABQ8S9Y3_PERAM|nr:hypothetical protein ANN_19386 [Periplaneta americana]
MDRSRRACILAPEVAIPEFTGLLPLGSPQGARVQGKSQDEEEPIARLHEAASEEMRKECQNRSAAPQTLEELGDALKEKWENTPKKKSKISKPNRIGPWSSIGALQINLNYQTKFIKKSIEYPDIQIYFYPVSNCGYATNGLLYYNSINFLPILLRPKSRGLVTINCTDPFSHPIIYTNYFNASEDIDTLLEANEVALRLSETKAFQEAGFVLDCTFQATRERIEMGNVPSCKQCSRSLIYSISHPSGTCKMGPDSDPDAVVDPELKVYGINRLRVVDASIMPTIISGNLNEAVIMIAEKAADLVKKSYSESIFT